MNLHNKMADGISPNNEKEEGFVEQFIAPSKLSLLLLHSNDEEESEAYISSLVDAAEGLPYYNFFVSAHVNLRSFIESPKLLACDTVVEQKENLVWQTCKLGVDNHSSPLTGTFTSVLVSYANGTDHSNSVPLHETFQTRTRQDRTTTRAIAPTQKILVEGVKFLRGTTSTTEEAKSSDELSGLDVNKLSKIYLNEISELKAPNTDTASLMKFIDEREWRSDHVWGGDKAQFLQRISGIENYSTKWTVLRDYIYYNMAWVTKLLLLPVDSLHRTAVADCALRGIPPPGANDALQKHVIAFGSTLTHDDEKSMLVSTVGTQKRSVENRIGLNCIVPTVMDSTFLPQMMNKSASTQDKGNHQMDHTVVHMLRSIEE